ncbi:hypothetical protein DCC85_04260 [Paenibacillus sp. CAA11]|uniref:hypothetical protein n=1 Tax=Paenibacillus sp. CAA11 TaxID=1532905 RepID=UPI000D38D2F9|nr:hypothetical protein [Paenibacillus sp. CAA11]AWB43512.1 hypothetical protein DCC85_04260 [Paenibacillus sp. CAA11]
MLLSLVYLLKNNLLKQVRSYSFLIVAGLCLALGYFCVPAAESGYEIFTIGGGSRGIYNSAWLGAIGTMLSNLLLWLFGFYLLRSQVSEDGRLKVGDIIASTRVTKLKYIVLKVLSNFVVLIVLHLLLIVAFMIMQLLRGEVTGLSLWGYAAPFVFITLPSMFLLAALTVLFDVIPGLKGTLGNILFFALWIFISIYSIESKSEMWDLFGLQTITPGILHAAVQNVPTLGEPAGFSFGYTALEQAPQIFVWNGVEWSQVHLLGRVIWILAGCIVTLISATLFTRFRTERKNAAKQLIVPPIYTAKSPSMLEPTQKEWGSGSFSLSSPVPKVGGQRIFQLVRYELILMLKGVSWWWWLLAVALIAFSLFVPMGMASAWFPLVLIWPLGLWSQMGTRDKQYFTTAMIRSSSPPIYKWLSVWLAGITLALLMSSGVLIQYGLNNRIPELYSWCAGILFVPTLALALGSLSGSRKLFEVVYMLWWYLGPMNHLPGLNFLHGSIPQAGVYLGLTLLLGSVVYIYEQFRGGTSVLKGRG